MAARMGHARIRWGLGGWCQAARMGHARIRWGLVPKGLEWDTHNCLGLEWDTHNCLRRHWTDQAECAPFQRHSSLMGGVPPES
jgi:hypothetical protein